MVSFASLLSGKYNDIFAIEEQLKTLVSQLRKSGISVDGLFLNADKGFDSMEFRIACSSFGIIPNILCNARRARHLTDDDTYFDELMYKERFIIERSNTWIDFNRTFLIRFDTSIESWITWHYIFSIVQWTSFISKV